MQAVSAFCAGVGIAAYPAFSEDRKNVLEQHALPMFKPSSISFFSSVLCVLEVIVIA